VLSSAASSDGPVFCLFGFGAMFFVRSWMERYIKSAEEKTFDRNKMFLTFRSTRKNIENNDLYEV
jgi:hypothetical protein